MARITKMVRTCFAAPSQWDGWDEEGFYYYFRYRGGSLTVEKCSTLGVDDYVGNSASFEFLIQEDVPTFDDSYLTLAQLKEIVGTRLELPEKEVGSR